MGGLQWSFLVLLGVLAPRLLDRPEWEQRLGSRLASWLRGAVLVALGYLFVVVEGNRISPSDVKVLAGFLGGALPLWLPLTGALLCLYYSAGVILVLSSWLRQSAWRSAGEASRPLCRGDPGREAPVSGHELRGAA